MSSDIHTYISFKGRQNILSYFGKCGQDPFSLQMMRRYKCNEMPSFQSLTFT